MSNIICCRLKLYKFESKFKQIKYLSNLKNIEEKLPPSFADNDSAAAADDSEIADTPPINCLKSRLLPQHRNILNNKLPYNEPHSWIHLTEKYQRKLFGKYGLSSNIDPRACYVSSREITNLGRISDIKALKDMIKVAEDEKINKQKLVDDREAKLHEKIQKLDQWKNELNNKIAKKEAEAKAAKERKERLVEEVRKHFGFNVDPRDDRFKELLEQKEKESRRKLKEEKKKAKEDKIMAKLVATVKASKTAIKE